MNIKKSIIEYYKVCINYDTEQEIKDQIESELDIFYLDYGLSLKEYIYNKQHYIDEFYKTVYGKN